MSGGLLQISEPGRSAKTACAGRAIGIDLGTTHSLVAAVRAGSPTCLKDESGRALLPSVVHYSADAEVSVGHRALEFSPQFPEDTFLSIKRFMGRAPKDFGSEKTATLLPYRMKSDPLATLVRFEVAGGREVTPVEVSAEILFALRIRAEEALDGPIDGAVITVPAYFDDAQRQATKDAGRLAGLEVLRLLNEPTAAALAYGLDRGLGHGDRSGTIAVYDFGGGTFDISILKLQDGVFEVQSTGGDTALGGDDFDREVVSKLFPDLDAKNKPRLARSVLAATRAARERLTTERTTTIDVEADGEKLSRELTSDELELLIAPVIARTGPPCRRAMKDAGISLEDLDGVVLVGGTTRTPAVRRFVRDLFDREPLGDIDPDEVVALGAAIQADLLAGTAAHGDVLLLDVIPLSLGLEMMGGVVEKVIPRNTTIPTGAKQTFTTFADGQTGFDLHVVQGEREMVDQCRSLARFQLTGIPPMPAGMARAEITFVVDADGILRVSAREETTGKEASLEVKPSYGLTDAEVERMLLESYAHADADVRTRLLAEERIEADRILAATQAALRDAHELVEPLEREAIEARLADLATCRQGESHLAIRAAIKALDEAAQTFASRRMNRALERAMVGHTLSDVEGKL